MRGQGGISYTDNMPSWKIVQSKKRKSKKIRLALAVLGLVILLILFSEITHLVKFFSSPWQLSKIVEKPFSWDSKFNIYVVIRSKEVSLLSYNPKEQKITLLSVPNQAYLDVPYGFGKWQMGSIYDLGEVEGQGKGVDFLKGSLEDFFGLPVDGFLNFGPPYDQLEASRLVDLLRDNPFSTFNLLPALKTDLTPWDLLRLKMNLSSVRFDKISEVDLKENPIFEKQTLADGTQVYMADPVGLDSVLSDFADPNFVSEGETVALFNATDQPALAQKAARIISNLGGHVIIVSNSKQRIKNTIALGQDSATLRRIRQIFVVNGTIEAESLEMEVSRAQINLFLGEDFIK